MIKIDAQPVFKRGAVAVWRGEDLPSEVAWKVPRWPQRSASAEAALDNAHGIPLRLDNDVSPGSFAAFRWADLQPKHEYTARLVIIEEMSGLKHGPGGSGLSGPCDAGCVKCACVRDLEALMPEGCLEIAAEPVKLFGDYAVWRLSDIPDGVMRGTFNSDPNLALEDCLAGRHMRHERSPALNASTKLYAAVSLRRLRSRPDSDAMPDNYTASTGTGALIFRELRSGKQFTPSPALVAQASAALVIYMGEASGANIDRSKLNAVDRELWAATLRAKVEASKAADRERERTRVLVDLEVEPWE